MKWRVAIGAAVLAVVVVVVGTVVALAGGSTGQSPTLITQPARYWLGQHAFFVPGQPDRVDIADVARTMLKLEPDFRDAHHVDSSNAPFRDELVTEACAYIFGSSARVDHALNLHGFRFDLQASGPNVSPRLPGGTDHDGFALQCGYSNGSRGPRLLELGVSSGGLTLYNLTTYAHARAQGVTGGFAFTARPRGLAATSLVHDYLLGRLARAAYLG
jgi:hypothetical protein